MGTATKDVMAPHAEKMEGDVARTSGGGDAGVATAETAAPAKSAGWMPAKWELIIIVLTIAP